MLTTLNRLTGLPVVRHGKQIALVEQAVPDAQARALLGLVVRHGLGPARWVPCNGVERLGERRVAVRSQPVSLPDALPVRAGLVYLPGGGPVGLVTDMLLCSKTFRIVALEVCPGPLYRLLGRCSYAREYCLQPEVGHVQAAGLLSWAQVNRMLKEEGE